MMDPVATLGSWRVLNAVLAQLNEAECLMLLEVERISSTPRINVLKRVHQRYTRLRANREFKELCALITS